MGARFGVKETVRGKNDKVSLAAMAFRSFCGHSKKIQTLPFFQHLDVRFEGAVRKQIAKFSFGPMDQFPVEDMVHKGTIGVLSPKVADNEGATWL